MEQKDYELIKAEYEASTDMKLVEWARPYFEGTKKPDNKDSYIVCSVSDRAADDIMQLTGSEVHGFTHVIRADVVRHIAKQHGKLGKSDHSVADIRHIGRIAYILENYDYIEEGSRLSAGMKNKNGYRATSVVFVKRTNGHVYTAEAVTDSFKSKCLNVSSLYLKQYVKNSAQKMEPVITDRKDLRPNVRNEADSVTSILPQTYKNVNSIDENNSDSSLLFATETSPRKLTRADYDVAKARRETERPAAKSSREVAATRSKKSSRRK